MGILDFLPSRKRIAKFEQQNQQLQELANELLKEIAIYKDESPFMKDQTDFLTDDFDLETYETMMKDGQVKAGVSLYQLGCIAKGYTVIGNDAETKKYADFILENFDYMKGDIEGFVHEMLSAIYYGFSCTEKVITQDPETGNYMLYKLKVLDPKTVRVKTNEFGDIEYVEQMIGSKKIRLAPEKVIWYAFEKRFGNLYGNSALRPVYKHWYIKDKMYRFANIAYERYGTPLIWGRVQDAKDVGKMNNLLKNINALTSLAISGQDEINAIHPQQADFVAYIEHHDRKIMESLLVPPMLLGLSKGQGGSYALTGNQFDVFMMRLESLQRDIQIIINEEIIKPLINFNFPNVKKYPTFSFKPLASEDIEKMANVFDKMLNAKIISPSEEWIREELGFPLPTPEVRSELDKARQQQQVNINPFQNGLQQGNNEQNQNNNQNEVGFKKKVTTNNS